MKKEELAKKMKGETCAKCGKGHKTSKHGAAQSGGDRGDYIESESSESDFAPQDKFSKKDLRKESETRAKKNSKLEKGGDWET